MANPTYNNADFAWFCGVFEGEGHVSHRSNGQGGTTRGLTIGSTDYDVLQRVRDITGVGNIKGPYERSGTNKPMYVWFVGRWNAVEPLIQAMLPWMGTRRRLKLEALLADPPKRIRLSQDGNGCHKGHPFTTRNTRIEKDGSRTCRTCASENMRRYRASGITT